MEITVIWYQRWLTVLKCDEQKPICGQCQSSLRRCSYAQAKGSSASTVPSPPGPISSHPPSPSQALELPQYKSRSTTPVSIYFQETYSSGTASDTLAFSDSELYQHFLENVGKISQSGSRGLAGIQHIIALAPKCEAVYHSLLALSAAFMCCNMILNENINPDNVHRALSTGLWHHNFALTKMRNMISTPEENNVECIVSNALWLFPFAFSFQHVNHWLLCKEDSKTAHQVTPREAILLLRGLETTLALNYKRDGIRNSHSEVHLSSMSAPVNITSGDEVTALSRSHLMFPIIAATSQHAFDLLQQRVELSLSTSNSSNTGLSACKTAFELLNRIRIDVFASSEELFDSAAYSSHHYTDPDRLRGQIPQWLRSYAIRPPAPFDSTEPLSRSFFHFFSAAPSKYVELLFPLLEESEESDSHQRTMAQYMAVDIYAHWLVLLLLIEKEAWWVGSFPTLALQGLMKRYNDEYLDTMRPEGNVARGKWWPESMLDVTTQIQQWK
jgi:hypothetical protein